MGDVVGAEWAEGGWGRTEGSPFLGAGSMVWVGWWAMCVSAFCQHLRPWDWQLVKRLRLQSGPASPCVARGQLLRFHQKAGKEELGPAVPLKGVT